MIQSLNNNIKDLEAEIENITIDREDIAFKNNEI